MSHEDIAAWEGFAVALAGAAAVLAGLVFVAVSINIDRILPVRCLPGRAGESVILFITALTPVPSYSYRSRPPHVESSCSFWAGWCWSCSC